MLVCVQAVNIAAQIRCLEWGLSPLASQMVWRLLVVLAAIGVLVADFVWKASQWNVRNHDYEPLAVVSGGETDTEKGTTEQNVEHLLLRGPPQLLCIITTLWLLVLLYCETMTWQRLVASLPGYIFATYLALVVEWKQETKDGWNWEKWRDRNRHLTVIITMAILLFLWLMVPFIEMPWYLVSGDRCYSARLCSPLSNGKRRRRGRSPWHQDEDEDQTHQKGASPWFRCLPLLVSPSLGSVA